VSDERACRHVPVSNGSVAAPVARCLRCGAEWPGLLGSEVRPDGSLAAPGERSHRRDDLGAVRT
jgi:hypothetical protein